MGVERNALAPIDVNLLPASNSMTSSADFSNAPYEVPRISLTPGGILMDFMGVDINALPSIDANLLPASNSMNSSAESKNAA